MNALSACSAKLAWRPWSLFLSLTACLTLFLTWYCISDVRALWDRFDASAYRLLNGGMLEHPWAQFICAFGNTRVFDGLVIALQVFWFVGLSPKSERQRRLAQFLFMMLFAHLALALTHGLMARTLEVARVSPTPHFGDGLRLKNYFGTSYLYVKDASWHSFPGDHSAIVFMWACFAGFFRGRRDGFWALLLAFVVSLPRMAAGGHWASDVLVGSISVGGALFSLAAFTPLHVWLVEGLTLPLLQLTSRRQGFLREQESDPEPA